MIWQDAPHPTGCNDLACHVATTDGISARVVIYDSGEYDTWIVNVNEGRLAMVIGERAARRLATEVVLGLATCVRRAQKLEEVVA